MKENEMSNCKILVINPGSTSTKIAVFDGEKRIQYKNIAHAASSLSKFKEIPEQIPMRKEAILDTLREMNVKVSDMSAIAGICTGLLPMKGGVYRVNELMAEHGRQGIGSKHPGNLGPVLVKEFADKYNIPGFTVNPSSVDEFCIEARVTGWKDVMRVSRGHPLNQKEVAMRYAADAGKKYEDLNLIVVHMGGGISVSVHQKGRMIDTVDSTNGEGRMAPTRSGALPALPLARICFSGKYTLDEIQARISKTGGWTDHLGTSDTLEIEKRIAEGDRYAKLIYEATIYQLGKDIGACAAVLAGNVDAIILTGGIAHSKKLTSLLTERIKFIAPVHIYAGEFEMEALAAGAQRVLEGTETPLEYTGEPVFTGFDEYK